MLHVENTREPGDEAIALKSQNNKQNGVAIL
jgi:hypothetical protein